MIDINWNNYKSKFNGKERGAFESLAYMLFCYEFSIRVGIFRFKNQTGIETEPIEVNELTVGFQAKYYDTKLADNKEDIIDSLKKAKSKNPDINKILVYTNQELAESSIKDQKNPAYLTDIETAAQNINMEIEWRVPSHFEKQLSVPENDYLAEYFFALGNGIIEFLDKLKAHSKNILFAIQTDIPLGKQHIKIDRKDTLLKLDKNECQVIILSGDGGSGKTAVIKDLFNNNVSPCYVFKAAEFTRSSLTGMFSEFGSYDIVDFLRFHKDESRKTFVIDSAEKLADLENQDTFIELLSALIKDGWKIIFTTRNSYVDDLSFQMLEVYRLPFDIVKLDNLSATELESLSTTFQFSLPDNARLQALICNLFYLNEYLLNYNLINGQTDVVKFRDILWQKRIQNSRFKKDNVHLEREKCFLNFAKRRCDTGNFFLTGDECSCHILSMLESDEIIKYDVSNAGYFVTHDIYEEWALEKIIEKAYVTLVSYPSFFESIGNSLPIRRAFRAWLSDKIPQNDVGIEFFIRHSFSEDAVPVFWKDELLISVLLSDYSFVFFKTFDKVLLLDNKFFLQKIIFLLRTACKEVDTRLNKIIQATKGASTTPAYVFTKPKGKGWETAIEYIHSKIALVQREELSFILPLLKEWVNDQPKGNAARLAGLFALHFYMDSELKEVYYRTEIEEKLLQIVMAAAFELKAELVEITEGLLSKDLNRQEAFDSLRNAILASGYDNFRYLAAVPEHAIKLADASWYEPKTETRSYYSSGVGVETHYSLRSSSHHDYFPASALQTPTYHLLQISFPKTINFILDFTNRTVQAYFKSGLDSSVHEIEVIIGSDRKKQIISSSLWNMYRGSGSPVTPYLLQSIHMALEKRLLEIAKASDKKNLKEWLIYLLKNTRSASITAIVTSVVLAYPDELFEVAAILFSNYDFYKYDNIRVSSESQAKNLYLVGGGYDKNKEYNNERLATCDDSHRKLSLENLALNYQYFKNNKISDDEADNRKNEVWKIIDYLYTTIPDGDSESHRNKSIRLLLARIDRRKMNPVISEVEDGTLIQFNPSLEPDLKQYSEKGMKTYQDKFKYTKLKLWATNKVENHKEYGNYPQYDENPKLVLKETKEIIAGLEQEHNEEFYLFNSYIPAYTCSSLIKLYSTVLSEDDLIFCRNIILSFATAPFNENYGYQISDGVEAAVSTLPFLYKLFPESKFDFNIILLFILFDTYPIGEYKRICDYAVEALGTLFELSPDDANTILFGYMFFKPKFDQENLEQRRKESKAREQILDEFATKYDEELKQIEPTIEYFRKIEVKSHSIKVAETVFQIIPADTTNPIHLDYIKDLLEKFSGKLLEETRYSDDKAEADYRLKHRFYRKFARFLLHRDQQTIPEWTKPFVDTFTITREMADFLSDVVSEECNLVKYESFWAIWECFYPPIKEAALTSRNRELNEIISNYLLAWPWWNDTAKDWRSLRQREVLFFEKVCLDMGMHPAVLYSISKFLNEVGSSFINNGIVWISDMLVKNTNLHAEELSTNTIYYLEVIVRKYVYLNKSKLKAKRLMRYQLLILLNFLVSKGSVNGYLLREDVY